MVRRRLLAATVACVIVATGLQTLPQAAVAAPPTTAAALTTAFGTYGDTSGRWAGGDGTVSVELPDGRVAWIFSDTFIGAVNANHSLATPIRMVNNSIVVQDGAALTSTITGGTTSAPDAVVATGVADEFYWVGDAIVEGSTLKVIYNRFHRTGNGSLDFAFVGSWLATFALPSLSLTGIVSLGTGSDVAWGASLISSGGFTYIYGTEMTAAGGMKFAHLARVPEGGLGGSWQFWNGIGWAADSASSSRLLSGVGSTFGMQYVGGQFVLVTTETNLMFSPVVVAYTASAPTGPFTGPIELFAAPEPAANNGKKIIVYNAQLHPEQAPSGKLLVSYDVNSLTAGDVSADIRLYRPTFTEVAWPRPAPSPSAPQTAPTGLTATADPSGTVHLTWTPLAGTTTAIFQRDVTSGQTHFARVTTVSGGSADIGLVSTGRTYEFRVAAVNASGEGPASAAVSATVVIAPPPAPTGVAAAADTTGKITVTWSPVPYAWNYDIYRRDVTAGQTEWVLANGAVTEGTTFTTSDLLEHQHVYEFSVIARHGGGDSPRSATVSATAFYAVPAAPTGLTAAAQSDGTITLNWTAPGPDVWFNVYQRDVTAGEAGFTKLPLPITTCCTMTAGYLTHAHTYEYRVAATNAGGESPLSTVASATSAYAPPATPTGLTGTPGNGSVTLTWTAPATQSWYWIYVRDVTAGESVFTRLDLPLTTCCTFTGQYLSNGHTYEFMIAGIGSNGGPDSAFSNVVSVVPAAAPPTNLTATAGDGQATLTWTESATPSWTWIYMRDVTAGESNFTKLEYPVSTCCTFTGQYLANGHTYEFKVAAVGFAGGLDSGPSNVVSVTPMAPPIGAPSNLTAVPGNGQATLTWTPGSTPSWYWIYVRDVSAGETGFTKLDYPLTTCCTFTGQYLTNGHTYEFKVVAIGSPGVQDSGFSNVASVVPLALPPTNLTAVAGNGQVTLSWTESATPSWTWIYMRDVTAGEATFTKLGWPVIGCCTFTGLYLANGHTYEFKVAAVGFAGGLDSVFSNTVTAIPLGPPPGAPSNLTATPGNGQVVLNWTAGSPGAWYWIYVRDVSAGEATFTKLEYPVTTCCTFTGQYLANGHTYEFKVVTVGGSGAPDSAPSNTVSVVPRALPPTNLVATPGNGQVVLTWTESATPSWTWIYVRDVTAGETGFTKLEYPLTTCCTFTGQYLANGHTYQFKVAAVGFGGGLDSGFSNTVTATPMAPQLPTPTGLTATAGDKRATLTWSTPSVSSWYWIYMRDVSNGETGFTKLAYPLTTCCTFGAEYLANGHVYEFKIQAIGSTGVPDSAFSAVVSVKPMPPFPQRPTNLTVSVGEGSVSLHWTASPTPEVYYWIYQRDVTNGQSWQKLPYPLLTCCTFNGGYLTNGHVYEWKVVAANLSGISDPTNTVSGRPLPAYPTAATNVHAVAGDAEATITWTKATPNRVWYRIIVDDLTAGETTLLQYPVLTCCTFKAGYLWNGHRYRFTVVAENEAGAKATAESISNEVTPMQPVPVAPSGLFADTFLTSNKQESWLALGWNPSPTSGVWQTLYLRDVTVNGPWYYRGITGAGTGIYMTTDLAGGHTYDFKVSAANWTAERFTNTVRITVMRSKPEQYYYLTDYGRSAYNRWRSEKGYTCSMDCGEVYYHSGDPYGWNWGDDVCSAPDLFYSDYEPVFAMGCVRHDFGYRNHASVGLNGENERGRIDYNMMYEDTHRMCADYDFPWYRSELGCSWAADYYYGGVRNFGSDPWNGIG